MALIAALCLDALFGEPAALWRRAPHPAVLMGRLVERLEARLNRGAARRRGGIVALAVIVALALAAGWGIAALPFQPYPQILAAAVLLAQRSLAEHVRDVARALDQSVEAGRGAVAKIVGRDTGRMDEPAIARAAIESAAENFSDGVVAPAFWFAVFGLPGMMIYKAVNTADSMIGHRTERYEEFGKAAAKLDDAMNYLPARLSALLIAAGRLSLEPFRAALREAPGHRSPNAGWPEAAMADALDVALAGPRRYDGRMTNDRFINPEGWRDIDAADIRRAVAMLWRAWRALLVCAVLVMIAA